MSEDWNWFVELAPWPWNLLSTIGILVTLNLISRWVLKQFGGAGWCAIFLPIFAVMIFWKVAPL